jgi:uncharacterized integral membrane protein
MTRLGPTIVLTVMFVAFALSNARRVALNFVFGETEVPLIVLLLASFTGGAVTVFVYSMIRTAERRALAKKVRIDVSRALRHAEVE